MKKSVLIRQTWIVAALLVVFCSGQARAQTVGANNSSSSADAALTKLEREIARLAKGAGGVVGVGALHVETGRRVLVNGGERFPMASTYKVPIAVQLLSRVDNGEVRLDQMINIQPSDIHPGSLPTSNLVINNHGVSLSVRNLLELMLLISDNSATDICLRLAGGPEAVTARMRAIGINGINVNRSTVRLIADFVGIAKLPPENELSLTLFANLDRAVTPAERKSAAVRFDTDPQDTASPDAMLALLERIHRKDLLKPESRELLIDIMRRCQTGEQRLKGLLPAGTVVAHKTGTIGGTTNDVGIITLPDNAGHVAITVFVKSSERNLQARERAIAEIARAVHDFFLFHPS